jgi:dethiobiotin synthetase
MQSTYFITGTGTGAGKTSLAALLTRFLRARGTRVATFKPICSGGRDDARILHAALDGAMTLDEINPWHFRAVLAPSLAARRENRSVSLAQFLAHIRKIRQPFDLALVEGAGGLLSPLGNKFDSRDALLALRATPIIVAPNALGVVNHLLLTLEALPPAARARAKIVLMSPANPDFATATNAGLLAEYFPARRIFQLPWLGKVPQPGAGLDKKPVTKALAGLLAK